MPKIDPNKKIQKQRTEQEMRFALQHFTANDDPIDIDDAKIVLNDVIEELLEKRQLVEEIRGFVNTWAPKFARR